MLPDHHNVSPLARGPRKVAGRDQPRRSHDRQVFRAGLRPAKPSQAARHIGNRRVRGARFPFQPLGLPAHRRRTPEEIGYMAEIADYRAMNVLRSRVDDVVKDPATAEALKPWYRWFCKRPCFHDDYLEAFNRPNVRLVDTQGRGVERLTKHGIAVGGRQYRADCIIFATGFEAGSTHHRLPRFHLLRPGP